MDAARRFFPGCQALSVTATRNATRPDAAFRIGLGQKRTLTALEGVSLRFQPFFVAKAHASVLLKKG